MRATPAEPWLAWPGWAHLRYALGQILLVSLWFGLVYFGLDRLTAWRTWRVPIHMAWELEIPLIPSFVLAYVSMYGLFLLVPFALRQRQEIAHLAREQIWVIALAGLGFLLLPADLAYAAPQNLGWWEKLFRWADQVNLDHNLVPSLHVALSVVCVEHLAAGAGYATRWLLRGWALLIAISTLLTHQHHVLDVVTGFALALGVRFYFQRRCYKLAGSM